MVLQKNQAESWEYKIETIWIEMKNMDQRCPNVELVNTVFDLKGKFGWETFYLFQKRDDIFCGEKNLKRAEFK